MKPELALPYLNGMNNTYCNHTAAKLNRIVLDDQRFWFSPGGVRKHHNYRQGLLVHTSEVMSNALSMAGGLLWSQRDVLVTSIIWHDYMKVRDYTLDEEDKVVELPYRRLIRHLSGSFGCFFAAATGTMPEGYADSPLSEEYIDRVAHCLLSHHGRQEWGSPVEPQTAEAFIIHAADMMSAHGIVLPVSYVVA